MVDEWLIEIMNIEAHFMSTYTKIRSITAADTFGAVEKQYQAEIQQRLKDVCYKLRVLKTVRLFKNAGSLIEYMIICLRNLADVVRMIHIEYANKVIKNRAEASISSYYDEFMHLESNLKQICEMHAMHSTENMERVVEILNSIISKLGIASDDDPTSPPTGPKHNA
jgi:hypothetical protein